MGLRLGGRVAHQLREERTASAAFSACEKGLEPPRALHSGAVEAGLAGRLRWSTVVASGFHCPLFSGWRHGYRSCGAAVGAKHCLSSVRASAATVRLWRRESNTGRAVVALGDAVRGLSGVGSGIGIMPPRQRPDIRFNGGPGLRCRGGALGGLSQRSSRTP